MPIFTNMVGKHCFHNAHTVDEACLTLLVMGFLVHSGIEEGQNVPTDIKAPVKPIVHFKKNAENRLI